MERDKKARVIAYQNRLLGDALKDMIVRGKGSPTYAEAYNRYRKAAQVLAHPILNDRVVKSRITGRIK